MKRGFTLLELLITVAIVAVMSVVAGTGYIALQRRMALDSVASDIVVALRRAQQKAIAQEEGVVWGIHFDNTGSQGFFSLFTGSPYNPANVRETQYIVRPVTFVYPESGTAVDVVFAKLTGFPAGTPSIIIQAGSSAFQKTITVNVLGTVTVQ